MFHGLISATLVVTGFLVLLPALMLYGAGGAEWLEKLRLMTPSR